MNVLIFLLKLILMFGLVGLMFAPLIAEYISFKHDQEKKITYKRFRVLVFSIVYFLAVTIAFVCLKDMILWIGSWKPIVWIINHVAIPARFNYAAAVFAVILLNFGVGLLFKVLLSFVRIGLKKKNLVDPKKKNGEYSLSQKIERKVLKFFNNEKWFFVAKALKFLCASLTIIYAVFFLFYQIPIFWGANWIPYGFAMRFFGAGYIYPMITLLPLWSAYFFLSGVELLEKECPELLCEQVGTLGEIEADVNKINEECKKLFKDFFAYQIKGICVDDEKASSEHHEVTKLIAKGIELDQRYPKIIKEGYLKALDAIVKNDMESLGDDGKIPSGILVNGGFFTEFSTYFLRYLSVILSRGDNVIFACNSSVQVEQVYVYVTQALEKMYSLYHSETIKSDISFDNPVWKVCKITESCTDLDCSDINNCSVLITDLKFLASQRFEKRCEEFICITDTVVFIDTVSSINNFPRQMALFNAGIKNAREITAVRAKNSSGGSKRNKTKVKNTAFEVRYTSNQIKYICFDDSRTPGLDKVLKNLLAIDFDSADSMCYNSNTIVCCYNYDGHPNKDGVRECPQMAKTREELGVLVNMADFAVAFGAGKVSLFAKQNIPHEDIAESIAANANNGLLVRKNVNIVINEDQYVPEDYSVVIAFDDKDNLPAAVRSFLSRASNKPTLVMLFSRPYLFRDYYLDNIETIWKSEQIMRIPVEQSGKHSAIQKILVKANAGGILSSEVISIIADANLEEYKDTVKNENLNEILRRILIDCGVHQTDALSLSSFFEFSSFQDFDNSGKFVVEERVHLRKRGMLFDLISGNNAIKVVIDGKESALSVPKDRITQNYIVGQNMLYDGGVYTINNINTNTGKLYISHATGGRNNVPYQYIQDREYHIVWSEEEATRAYATKSVAINKTNGLTVKDVKISVMRRPMEVITKGYTPVNPHTLAMNGVDSNGYISIYGKEHIDVFRQTYRKYGEIKEPICSSDMIMKNNSDIVAASNGALVMSIKLTGEFGNDAKRISTLAAVMLGEVLRAMFPSVADAFAVCPVVKEKFDDDESKEVLDKQPEVFCRGYESNAKDIELLIIEDCRSDLGVISVLMSSGDDVLKLLFSPIREYLQWYLKKSEKSSYLYFGKESEPKCFDFEGLEKLAGILGDEDFKNKFVDANDVVQYDVCDFCGKRFVKGTDISILEDGRKLCKDCGATIVGNDKKVLKEHLERAKIFLESTYNIKFDDDYEFCFESTVKIANTLKQNNNLTRQEADVSLKSYVDDKKKVHVEYSVPSVSLSEILVRELTHVWQLKRLPDLKEELAEGHIALVAVQYLRFLNQKSLAAMRTTYYESTSSVAGEGYRRLVRELLDNPQFDNNPFRYLLETSGVITEEDTAIRRQIVFESGDYGLPYKVTKLDRALDGNIEYFYYSRLTASCQRTYDVMLEAIKSHEEKIVVEGCTFDDVRKVSRSILYDHPELFWYKTFSMAGTEIYLFYGVSVEEADVIQKRIDEVIPKYLEGIDDTMSAYDVALRIHVKIISSVDYDTIALDNQEQQGGPEKDEIDYLRTICGVFLNGKAVCEGYARAMQYLLQKCGIECAEIVGNIHKENGESDEAHAWNILKIDGDYYYLDATWDDRSNTIQTVKKTDFGFDYFCVTTEEMSRTRDFDLCPTEVPKCDATRGNYYYHNEFVLDSYDLNKIKAMSQNAAKNRSKFFTFKCNSKALFEQTFNQLCAVGQDCYDVLKAVSKIDKQVLDNTYSYTYNKEIWTITIKFKYK